jgi:hypothetical protein
MESMVVNLAQLIWSVGHECLLAPMQDEWYQRDQVKKGLNQNHNMIIIDGPPGKLRNGKRDYGGFL